MPTFTDWKSIPVLGSVIENFLPISVIIAAICLALSWGNVLAVAKFGICADATYHRSQLATDAVAKKPPFSLPSDGTASVPSEVIAAYAQEMNGFYRYASCQADIYRGVTTLLPITAIVVAFLTTIASLKSSAPEWKTAASIFSSGTILLASVQATYPVGEAGHFYGDVRARTGSLISEVLLTGSRSVDGFLKIVERYQALVAEEEKGTPRVNALPATLGNSVTPTPTATSGAASPIPSGSVRPGL